MPGLKVNKLKNKTQSSLKSLWLMSLLASLTLGLAPFLPEPHVWGKIKWILGGAEGMSIVDYFDFAMHFAPWAAFIYLSISLLVGKK